ncbi:MAG TPA: hypothetical protein VGP82_12845 [Ktedonobacterales bacterium]|nr:hypothetical protein [Ktedonobacterales bacterium]
MVWTRKYGDAGAIGHAIAAFSQTNGTVARRIQTVGVLGILLCWVFLLAQLALIVLRAWRDLSPDEPASATIAENILFAALTPGLALLGILSVADALPTHCRRVVPERKLSSFGRPRCVATTPWRLQR